MTEAQRRVEFVSGYQPVQINAEKSPVLRITQMERPARLWFGLLTKQHPSL